MALPDWPLAAPRIPGSQDDQMNNANKLGLKGRTINWQTSFPDLVIPNRSRVACCVLNEVYHRLGLVTNDHELHQPKLTPIQY